MTISLGYSPPEYAFALAGEMIAFEFLEFVELPIGIEVMTGSDGTQA